MENVDDDDDFGDLYTDVEVQASSAISAVIQSSTLKPLTEVEHSAVEKCNGETEVRKEECESESESEDDLNIVLNDSEDYNDFLNEDETEENAEGSGSGHNSNGSENRNGDKTDCKYTRPPHAAYSSHLKDNESSCVHSYPTPLANSNWDENGCRRMDSSSAAQNGLNFSLPRSRNILDVNIDMFEKKPWRNPGADLTDYFNFGFNEDSWKHYCSCLDRHREQAKREAKDSYYKTLKNNTPNGRVIEVEESTIERQPSMNLGRSQDRDSGVVIQITLQDSVEDPVNSPKEQGKASESGDAGEDRRDQFFSSASEDELPSLEGTGGGSGNSTSRRNTPVRECASMDSDNYVNSEFSDRTLGEIESSHDAKKSSKRDISNPGTSVMSREALYGKGQDHSRCSSRSHGVASRDHPKRLRNAKSELRGKGRIDYPPRTSGGSDYFTQSRRFRKRDEDFGRSGPMIRHERYNSSMVQHRKRDGRHAFDSREREVTSHFKEVKPFRSNARSLSDYPLRVTYTKHDDPLELSAATDDALSEDRSHFVAIDESGYLIDDYIPYLDYEKIDRMRNNKRTRTDDLVTECKFIYDITKETDSRYRPYSDRDTSSLQDYYHVNLTYFRRETKSPRRGGRRDKSPRNSLHGECCMGLNNEEGRFDRWQNPTLSCGRHRIFCGSPISANQRIKYPVDRDNFERGGGYPLSEQLQWVEDENDSLYRQNILDAERTSSVFSRISRDRRFESFDKKHRSNLVGTLLDDRNMNHKRYIVMREGNNAGEIGQGSKFFHKVNHRRRFSRWKDSAVPSTVVENIESSGWRSSNLDSGSYVEPKPMEGIKNHHVRKTLRTRNLKVNPNDNGKGRLDIFSNAQQEESLDIEEGQIIPEELNEKIVKGRKTCFGKSQISEMKSSANDNMVSEAQDNARILEIMAKMEKRRERFKEPIAPKTGPENVSKPSIDLFAGTTEAIQPRPARKRKWV